MSTEINPQRIHKLFAAVLQVPVEKLNLRANLITHYKFDSLTFTELTYLLEDVLGLVHEWDYDVIRRLRTIEDFTTYIMEEV